MAEKRELNDLQNYSEERITRVMRDISRSARKSDCSPSSIYDTQTLSNNNFKILENEMPVKKKP